MSYGDIAKTPVVLNTTLENTHRVTAASWCISWLHTSRKRI